MIPQRLSIKDKQAQALAARSSISSNLFLPRAAAAAVVDYQYLLSADTHDELNRKYMLLLPSCKNKDELFIAYKNTRDWLKNPKCSIRALPLYEELKSIELEKTLKYSRISTPTELPRDFKTYDIALSALVNAGMPGKVRISYAKYVRMASAFRRKEHLSYYLKQAIRQKLIIAAPPEVSAWLSAH